MSSNDEYMEKKYQEHKRKEEQDKERDGIAKYGMKYLIYGRRFESFEIRYLSTYDLRDCHRKYEFTAPFNLPPRLDEKRFKYTSWEKLTGNRKRWEQEIELAKSRHNERCAAANHSLRQADYLLREIFNERKKASDQLNIAEKEFSNKAYALFWEAIETSAQAMENVAFLVWGLSVKIKHDYSKWESSGNFPPFFFLEAIPDITDLISKYDKLVRQGLSNYEFASIWEARKTRQTIIVGFQNLENAIHGVGQTIRNGFTDLNAQLESNARDQLRATKIQTLVINYGLRKDR